MLTSETDTVRHKHTCSHNWVCWDTGIPPEAALGGPGGAGGGRNSPSHYFLNPPPKTCPSFWYLPTISPHPSPQGSVAHSANSWSEHSVSLPRLRAGWPLWGHTAVGLYPDPTPYPEPRSLTSLDSPGHRVPQGMECLWLAGPSELLPAAPVNLPRASCNTWHCPGWAALLLGSPD